jgi:hypothetical protein
MRGLWRREALYIAQQEHIAFLWLQTPDSAGEYPPHLPVTEFLFWRCLRLLHQ